jgi:hypothetical protein
MNPTRSKREITVEDGWAIVAFRRSEDGSVEVRAHVNGEWVPFEERPAIVDPLDPHTWGGGE